MKYFLLEPTYKKSVVEWTLFQRKDEDGKTINLRKELGWRWGSWLISIPETEEECMEVIKKRRCDTVLDYATEYGHTMTDPETKEEVLPEDFNIQEMLQSDLMPSETEESVDITEDYNDAEMLETSDGCWEFWSVDSFQVKIDEETSDQIIAEAEEAYGDNYEEGLAELGWQFADTYFEMSCSPKLTPCDENGGVTDAT